MKSEMKMPRDRDREVKFQNNSREFSRNETLAGYWCELKSDANESERRYFLYLTEQKLPTTI